MTIRKTNTASTIKNKDRRQRGFTVVEVLVTVAVVTVIASIVLPNVMSEYEKARISACKAELDLMKAVAYDMGDGRYIPTPDQFWGEGFPNAEEGEYYYIVDSQDANKGHGNDLDGCDEDNPGNSPRCPGMDIKFVVFCAHDHGEYAKYCYATDDLPPTAVLTDEEDDFNFQAQKDKNSGRRSQARGQGAQDSPRSPSKSTGDRRGPPSHVLSERPAVVAGRFLFVVSPFNVRLTRIEIAPKSDVFSLSAAGGTVPHLHKGYPLGVAGPAAFECEFCMRLTFNVPTMHRCRGARYTMPGWTPSTAIGEDCSSKPWLISP